MLAALILVRTSGVDERNPLLLRETHYYWLLLFCAKNPPAVVLIILLVCKQTFLAGRD